MVHFTHLFINKYPYARSYIIQLFIKFYKINFTPIRELPPIQSEINNWNIQINSPI